MEKQTEETLYRIADYTNNERDTLTKRMHVMFIAGIAGFVLFFALDMMDLADTSPYDFTGDPLSLLTGGSSSQGSLSLGGGTSSGSSAGGTSSGTQSSSAGSQSSSPNQSSSY